MTDEMRTERTAEQERAAVAAWLREEADYYNGLSKDTGDGIVAGCFTFAKIAVLGIASCIEQGQHIKETPNAD